MRMTVFGATGNVDSRVVAEAASRGHEITAVVRDPARVRELPGVADIRASDAGNIEDVVAASAGQDAVISAARPPTGAEHELATIAATLLAGLRGGGVRLLLVGGAASLTVPGSGGCNVIDDPRYLPPAARDIALACMEQLEVCRAEPEADWTYLSPPALLQPGKRTGSYRVGTDELLVDGDGNSTISMEDFAVALLDEAERPRHRRTRFTVAY